LTCKIKTQTYRINTLETDEYLELIRPPKLRLAAPGEKVMIVPKNVAMKYVDPSSRKTLQQNNQPADHRSRYTKNLEAWRDFLLGRNRLGLT
jgi:hypothetical protein